MSYSKQEWTNNVSAIDEDKMNHIENGIYNNSVEIDKLQSTSWTTATLDSAFDVYGQGLDPAKYRKTGKTVEIKGVVTPTTDIPAGNTVKTIFTLPTGYRPSSTIYGICQGSGMNKWTITVYSNGNVGIQRYGTNEYTAAAAGVWLPFYISFLVD